MKYIGICFKGLEDFVSKFVKGKIINSGRVEFSDLKDIKFFDSVYEFVDNFEFSNFEDLLKKLKVIEVDIKRSFLVKCNREGEHDFRSLEVEREFGEYLFNKGFKVDLKNPDIKVFVDIIDNKCYLGILKLFNLGKRDYRVKLNNQSINGCLAYTLIKIADVKKNEILVDPFCKDGVVCIEAKLMGVKKVYGIDFNRSNLLASQLNSKIANADVEFIEGDVSWLNTKFKDKEVRIVTSLPFSGVNKNLLNIYKEFFKEAKAVGKNEIVVISGNDKFYEYCGDFKIVKREFFIGKMKYYLGILS